MVFDIPTQPSRANFDGATKNVELAHEEVMSEKKDAWKAPACESETASHQAADSCFRLTADSRDGGAVGRRRRPAAEETEVGFYPRL